MSNISHNQFQQAGIGNSVTIQALSSGALADCTLEELRHEKRIRQGLLAQERQRLQAVWMKLLFWLLSGGAGAWLTGHWLPWTHWLMITIGFAGVVVPTMALYALSQQGPSEFEQRQQANLREIDYLVREKSFAEQQ
jgi:hypothetical protein